MSTSPDLVVNVGDHVSLTCKASGDPEPVITWIKDDIRVTSANRFVLQPSGELSIREIGKSDEGNYKCVAKNEVGSDVKIVRVVVRGTKSGRSSDKPAGCRFTIP